MTAGTRVAIGTVVVLGVTAYMAYVGAASSWQYYLSVDECVADANALLNDRIRVSGKIASSSLEIANDRGSATFRLEGSQSGIRVACSGPLPDNLAEERHVVVEGHLENTQLLLGHKVLTKCASKYASGDIAPGGGPSSIVAQKPDEPRGNR